MMKYLLLPALTLIAFLCPAQVHFTAGDMNIGIDKKGFLTALTNTGNQKDYLSKDTVAPLITLVSGGKKLYPASMSYSATAKK